LQKYKFNHYLGVIGMAWEEPTQPTQPTTNQTENTIMADTILTQPNNDIMGGGLGAILIGSMLGRGGMFGNQGVDSNSNVLQAMNQQQLASATQIMTQDINRAGHDVATSAANTQQVVANGVLQQTISTLNGQSGINSQVAAAAADVNANINNMRNGVNADIRDALGVIDADLHGMAAQMDSSIGDVRKEVTDSRLANATATHAAQVSQLESAYRTLQAITTDGDRTRDLINANNTATLNREITVAQLSAQEAREAHRHTAATNEININNNNNALATANAMQSQLQAQQQQQQLSALTNGLTSALHSINQTVINTGTMRGNALGAVQV
jgi:hypothetical protein